jgi:hypothetical protein
MLKRCLEDLRDHLYDYWFIHLLISLCGYAVFLLVTLDSGKEEFMAECVQHHAKYECTLMWRLGTSESTPIPIVTPVR